jgi:hypothetical protein
MIAFKDFAPRMTDTGGLLGSPSFQTMEETVERASLWCEKNGVVPLNIETLLLPDIHDEGEEGSGDPHLVTGTSGTEWHQVVRVWYFTKSAAV